MLPEISVSPKIQSNVSVYITPIELRNNLDSYLKNRTPVTFLTELRGYLQSSPNTVSTVSREGGGTYVASMNKSQPIRLQFRIDFLEKYSLTRPLIGCD